VAAWLVAKQKQPTKTICFQLKAEAKPRPLPPKAWAAGEVKKSVKLGEVALLF
jgi:hypothetical protein